MKLVELINRKEAAASLGLAPQTLAKWAMTGKNLPVIRLGNRAVRYRRGDVEDFIKKCTANSRDSITPNMEQEKQS